MMEYYLVYNRETGDFIWPACGEPGAAAAQVFEDPAFSTLIVPQNAHAAGQINMEAIRAFYETRIDSAYLAKVPPEPARNIFQELKADELSIGGDKPLLEATAEATGKSLAEVEREVGEKDAEYTAEKNAWFTQIAQIEGLRMKAKAALRDASTFMAFTEIIENDTLK